MQKFLIIGWMWFVLLPCCSTTVTAGTWELVPEKTHHVEATLTNGVINLKTTGTDPFLIGRVENIGSEDSVLAFEYTCAPGVSDLQIYFGPPFGGNTSCLLPGVKAAKTWRSYSGEIVGNARTALAKNPDLLRIDFGRTAGVQIQIRNLRLRPRTEAEVAQSLLREQKRQAKVKEAKRIREYLLESFPVSIDSVQVKSDQIILTGSSIPDRVALTDLQLIEYPPWHSVGRKNSGIVMDVSLEPLLEPSLEASLAPSLAAAGDQWRAVLPRFESSRDRLYSGWRLQYETGDIKKYVTSRRFATEIESITNNFPQQRLRPDNQKGMGGIRQDGPLEELVELGITAITVNIPLNAFVAERDNPDFQRLDVPGEPVYFNPRGFPRLDSVIDWARENDIVVTAILLVATPKNMNRPSVLVHPENEGGNYAMPNLATERGSIIYGHVLERIAARYSNSEKSPGGITNWIAHNEIDYHLIWTNMGHQPREIVTETYYRSMRMIHNAALQHNPHARVFTSTTHHWYVPDDDQWTRLAPGELCVALQRYSKSEGDFGWGVGHHPYPSDLRASLAWNDKHITDDIKTPKITIQNIEVLGRFLELKFMADSQGNPRPVLLSEQGFNSVSYNEEDQANQAGSLAYAMKKIRAMPMVESFHYHRWIDHPDEPLAKFGLRTLPSKTEKFGKKKRAWTVYQAIGTPRENEVTRGLPAP